MESPGAIEAAASGSSSHLEKRGITEGRLHGLEAAACAKVRVGRLAELYQILLPKGPCNVAAAGQGSEVQVLQKSALPPPYWLCILHTV